VSTFNDKPYDTRFSGNVIDICPVGALTNTDFRFTARTWDLTNASTLCGHCACNCNMTLGTRLNEMKRVTTRPNDLVDDGWICDKARWGYDFNRGRRWVSRKLVSKWRRLSRKLWKRTDPTASGSSVPVTA
jgi:NADH-quinone oxidoreductase subunit G